MYQRNRLTVYAGSQAYVNKTSQSEVCLHYQGPGRDWGTAVKTRLYADLKDVQCRQRFTRNGYLPEREIQTGIGPV